jgi:hypothetical protein
MTSYRMDKEGKVSDNRIFSLGITSTAALGLTQESYPVT